MQFGGKQSHSGAVLPIMPAECTICRPPHVSREKRRPDMRVAVRRGGAGGGDRRGDGCGRYRGQASSALQAAGQCGTLRDNVPDCPVWRSAGSGTGQRPKGLCPVPLSGRGLLSVRVPCHAAGSNFANQIHWRAPISRVTTKLRSTASLIERLNCLRRTSDRCCSVPSAGYAR